MAQLATQAVTLAGVSLAHATASVGGDVFTPDAHTILHAINTGTGPITVTIASQARVLDEHAADVAVTVAAGAEASIGPFPAEFFADPSDGLAHIAYSDAAHTQIAAAVARHAGAVVRGTIITRSNATPADLPSGSLLATDAGDMYAAPSPAPPIAGQAITSGTTAPTDLPDGSLYFLLDGSGAATDLYLAPGISAAEVLVAATAPADLAANQLAVLIGPTGTATDLYVGGIS